MRFKKTNFIGLILILLTYIFGVFSNTYALNYQFDAVCNRQNLSNNESLEINLDIVDGYSKNLRLHPFECKIKFNKSLFDFKNTVTSRNIYKQDIFVEHADDGVIIKFNPINTRIVNLRNDFAEILKINFICKSADSFHQSFFKIELMDAETQNYLLSKVTEVTIKNEVPINIPTKNMYAIKTPNQKSSDCRIKSIIPSFGSLNPSFNPNTLKYNVEVPREVQDIYFDITPIENTTKIAVNKHKLGTPGTITYINITSKNQSKTLSYIIGVKRNINFSSPEANGKVNSKTSGSSNAKRKNVKSNKSKSKSSKHKRNGKNSKSKNSDDSADEEFNDGDEEDDNDEDDEDLENSSIESNHESVSSSLKNNKIYWIIVFAVLILSAFVYLFIKRKSSLLKNKNDATPKDINNNVEK